MDSTTCTRTPNSRRRRRWLGLAALGLLVVGIAGFARAHGPCGGDPAERAAFAAGHIADRVDATPEQEAAIERELLGLFEELQGMKAEKEALRAEAKAALTAASVDPAAVEALRGKAMERADAASVEVADALVAVANVLTAEQRADLADDLERMRRRWER